METEQRKVAEEKSLVDPLTQVSTRDGLKAKFSGELSRVLRFERGVCVIFIDVDNYGAFNKLHGELTGDRVLREVTKTLVGSVRPYDVVCRWGGEEFIVLLPETTSVSEACKVAERIRKNVDAMRVKTNNGEGVLTVTVSAGVAALDDATGLQELLAKARKFQPISKEEADGVLERLIENANEAERKAKEAGRNRTCVFL